MSPGHRVFRIRSHVPNPLAAPNAPEHPLVPLTTHSNGRRPPYRSATGSSIRHPFPRTQYDPSTADSASLLVHAHHHVTSGDGPAAGSRQVDACSVLSLPNVDLDVQTCTAVHEHVSSDLVRLVPADDAALLLHPHRRRTHGDGTAAGARQMRPCATPLQLRVAS